METADVVEPVASFKSSSQTVKAMRNMIEPM